MVRLSIVIPATPNFGALESTLVSVLANRPSDCEVVVVLSQPYNDPYDLTDEVRFVSAPNGASWCEQVNLGFNESGGSIVHVLEPGSQVHEGWTQLALRHFTNPQVAAVAPLVLNGQQPDRALALGVQYARRGERILVGAGVSACAAAALPSALGPVRWAGFYRRSAVLELLGGFDGQLDSQADVDLALRLQAAGYRSISEPRCQITLENSPRRQRGFGEALRGERLFWRNSLALGAVLEHLKLIAGEAVQNPVYAPALLCGRVCGLFEMGSHLKHRARMRAIRRKVTISLALAESGRKVVRVDEPQTLPLPRRTVERAGRRRAAA